jgi:hypothetical protein
MTAPTKLVAGREESHFCRLDDNGEVDEIVVDCSLVTLERMSNGSWALGIYRDKALALVYLNSKRAITAQLNDDEIGLVDDVALKRVAALEAVEREK